MLRVHKDRVRLPPLEGTWQVVGVKKNELFQNERQKETISRPNSFVAKSKSIKSNIHLAKSRNKLGSSRKSKHTLYVEQNPQNSIEKTPGPAPRDVFTSRTIRLPIPTINKVDDIDNLRTRGWVLPTTDEVLSSKRNHIHAQAEQLRLEVKAIGRRKTGGEVKTRILDDDNMTSACSLLSDKTKTKLYNQRAMSMKHTYDAKLHRARTSSTTGLIEAQNRREKYLDEVRAKAKVGMDAYIRRRSDDLETNDDDTKELRDRLRWEKKQKRIDSEEKIKKIDADIQEIRKYGSVGGSAQPTSAATDWMSSAEPRKGSGPRKGTITEPRKGSGGSDKGKRFQHVKTPEKPKETPKETPKDSADDLLAAVSHITLQSIQTHPEIHAPAKKNAKTTKNALDDSSSSSTSASEVDSSTKKVPSTSSSSVRRKESVYFDFHIGEVMYEGKTEGRKSSVSLKGRKSSVSNKYTNTEKPLETKRDSAAIPVARKSTFAQHGLRRETLTMESPSFSRDDLRNSRRKSRIVTDYEKDGSLTPSKLVDDEDPTQKLFSISGTGKVNFTAGTDPGNNT